MCPGITETRNAAPIRKKALDEIDTNDILGILEPLWQTKPETAHRLRGRIERVLNAAKVKGLRSGENPAAWRGHLELLLPKRAKLTRGHFAALPYTDIPAFIRDLKRREGLAARALEFLILGACRSGEVRHLQWSELDMNAKIWTVPKERMKAGRPHRVPLTDRMIAILREIEQMKLNEQYVFVGPNKHRPFSDAALGVVLKRMKIENCTVHGFRSSFRDWAGDNTSFPREVAEAALAHMVGDATERAYRRGDAFSKRRNLMEDWGEFCGVGQES
ncbi:site-specific integrase [Roseibium aggregatum]|uniref:Site-specific integrase n=1 Tax=Roseibium aggregatum TaxID=187304 RepID=A0A926P3S1_9HYPH|nr:site-specific integrase [Roseibium aggregatum]